MCLSLGAVWKGCPGTVGANATQPLPELELHHNFFSPGTVGTVKDSALYRYSRTSHWSHGFVLVTDGRLVATSSDDDDDDCNVSVPVMVLITRWSSDSRSWSDLNNVRRRISPVQFNSIKKQTNLNHLTLRCKCYRRECASVSGGAWPGRVGAIRVIWSLSHDRQWGPSPGRHSDAAPKLTESVVMRTKKSRSSCAVRYLSEGLRLKGRLEYGVTCLSIMMMMMKWCLMSSDVSWHIRDKLWPMPKHGSIFFYVHGNQKAR